MGSETGAVTLATDRIERLIQSRKTQWSEIPADLLPVIEKAKTRLGRWRQKENRKQTAKLEWTHPDGISREVHLDLIGELRSAESRKRLATLNHDINKLRETRCEYLISLQPNAIQAIRLKKLLQAQPGEQLKPIPRLFTTAERQRVEEIHYFDFEVLFGRQSW